MRLIDADALLDDIIDRICNDCDKRKGIKDGKWRIIYSIGDAPCRACSVDDTKDDIDSAPTIDAVPVVRCQDCKWFNHIIERINIGTVAEKKYDYWECEFGHSSNDEWFCADGVRKDATD